MCKFGKCDLFLSKHASLLFFCKSKLTFKCFSPWLCALNKSGPLIDIHCWWGNYNQYKFIQNLLNLQPTLMFSSFSVLLICIFFLFFFNFFFIFKLYIIVLVLPNIKMNPPQVYMCSRPWTLFLKLVMILLSSWILLTYQLTLVFPDWNSIFSKISFLSLSAFTWQNSLS